MREPRHSLVILHLAALVILFAGYQLFGSFLSPREGEPIYVSDFLLLFLAFACLGGALYAGVAWLSPKWTQRETERSGYTALGLVAFSGICFSGGCIPSAALWIIFKVLPLLPVFIGAKVGTFAAEAVRGKSAHT